jgi:antitoxin (DNA-binding transcriptional repressor) of toxin-antitoxin stability system
MTTLTITDAKKNLGKWLNAAVHGEDVGIISGAAIVALKPVKVRIAHPVEIREIDYEYARREYGVTRMELDRFKKRSETNYQKAKREGALIKIENPTLEKIEEALNRPTASPKRAARSAEKRTS